MYDRLYEQLSTIISPFQHVFVGRKSTVTNLLPIIDFSSNDLDTRTQTHVIYRWDMSKTYDKIKHVVIIKKIFKNNVSIDTCEWFGFSSQIRDNCAS